MNVNIGCGDAVHADSQSTIDDGFVPPASDDCEPGPAEAKRNAGRGLDSIVVVASVTVLFAL